MGLYWVYIYITSMALLGMFRDEWEDLLESLIANNLVVIEPLKLVWE